MSTINHGISKGQFFICSAGCVVTVSGRMTFTSNKSMEIEVFVDADPLVEAEKGRYRAVTAFFTYISLDKEGKPLPVPPMKVTTPPKAIYFMLSSFCVCFSLFNEQCNHKKHKAVSVLCDLSIR